MAEDDVPRPFLTAEWRDLVGVTFACDEARLAPYLPPGAEIDTLEGSPRVSLVAFRFARTRVLGVPVPGHIAFPEINLRFYVRFRGERAVVFIRELVPRRAIATIAKLRYNEPYVRVPMACGRELDAADTLQVWHRFAQGSSLRVTASATGTVPAPGSPAHWLTDHALGIGRRRNGDAVIYHVGHPTWALHEITDLDLDVDFAAVYGAEWAWLADTEPSHVSLATGSAVSVSLPVAA
ncbi:YqjF family protein [Baekduia sp. Peel2402]|uniref:YqjF family protein n=1 Tax=Baekduia sp. Peel2402 TaxID=3458296 RepID=UPI00403EBA21